MKKAVLMLSLAVSLMGMASFAHADLNSFLLSVNKQASSDTKNFAAKLSVQFGVPLHDVDAIVKRMPSAADAFMIFQIGQMAHVGHERVLQKYQGSQGKGWGKLAQDMGIKPGSREFHALKRGNLSFTGERSGNAMEHGGGHGNGKGNGHRRD